MGKRRLTKDEHAMAAVIAAAVERDERTQDEIAAAVGVSQGTIWQWANAKIAVPVARAQKLADELKLKPNEVCAKWSESVKERWHFDFERTLYDKLSDGQKIALNGKIHGWIVDLLRENGGDAGPQKQLPAPPTTFHGPSIVTPAHPGGSTYSGSRGGKRRSMKSKG